MLPLAGIGNVDDLLDRARRGTAAGAALDAVKETLTRLRDDKYRAMLNAPDDKVLALRAELKAIEQLAQSLLVQEAQGNVALEQLYNIPGVSKPKPQVLKPEVTRKRSSRPKTATAEK